MQITQSESTKYKIKRRGKTPNFSSSTKIKVTDTKMYVPVVNSSTQDNEKLLQ